MKSASKFNTITLIELYGKGLSMRQIAEKLDCSSHKVVYWMDKLNIRRRSRSEANYLFYNPNGDPFQIKKGKRSSLDEMLFSLGVGIYWGEGDKVSHHQVRVTNTDPALLRIFIKFLLKICNLNKDKISYSLVCFNDSNISDALNYWAKELEISETKFGKIVQIPPQGKGTYKRKSQFGVCSVIVSNIKLKAWIMNELDKLRKL